MPVIGFLHSGTAEQNANRLTGFRKGLADAGFVDGKNLTIEYRWANGQANQLPELAADLVRRQVAVIVAVSSQPATLAAKAATSTIPIVFTWPGDPVARARRQPQPAWRQRHRNRHPERRACGQAARLLRELAPQATPISVLFNPADPSTEAMSKDLQAHAQRLGVQLQLVYAGTDGKIDAAFTTFSSKSGGALLVNADSFFLFARTNHRAGSAPQNSCCLL